MTHASPEMPDGWAKDVLTTASSVTIYRAVPETITTIRPGDWVALDDGYTDAHADGMSEEQDVPWHTVEAIVPTAHVRWAGADKDEWYGSWGEPREFIYEPTIPQARR